LFLEREENPTIKEHEMKRVYFTPWSQTENMLQKTEELCKEAGIFDVVDQNDKVSYLNFAHDVSTVCDCVPITGQKFIDDVGVFASHSALSIDAVGVQYIDVQHLNEIHGVDSQHQIRVLEGLAEGGSSSPEVITV
jgi:uncharacterized Fe-S center protein